MLNLRENQILKSIVKSFIDSGSPIGSRTLVKSYNLGLSSATIRNVMSDLEDLGYLNKTHHSSGRIPSIKALKYYISSIIDKEVSEKKRTDNNSISYFDNGKLELEQALAMIGKLLNDITDYASLTFISKDTNKLVKEIFIKEVSKNSYILLIMLSDDEIYTKLISMESGSDFIETEKFNNFLSHNFKNKSTNFLIKNLIPLFKFTFYCELEALKKIVDDFNFEESDKLQLYGISRLLEHPDFDELHKIRQVASFMEDDREIRDIISSEISGGIKVYMSDDQDDPLSSLTMITSTYHIHGDRIASFGVIAPMRINYNYAISTIVKIDRDINKIIEKN